MDRQGDRQSDRQEDRQGDRQEDRQKDKQEDRQKDKQEDRQEDTQGDRQTVKEHNFSHNRPCGMGFCSVRQQCGVNGSHMNSHD